MPWFPCARDQFLRRNDKRFLIEKDSSLLCLMKQTKIQNFNITTHVHRDGNGSTTLLINSKIKKFQNWNFCYKHYSDYADYELSSGDRRSWHTILQSLDEHVPLTRGLINSSVALVTLVANAIE